MKGPLVVFDLTEKRWLGKAWAAYAATFPSAEGVTSWAEVKHLVRNQGEGRDLQVWGHGSPGRPFIGREAADPSWDMWNHLDSVWFRSCSVANGRIGHSFMSTITNRCDAAAHLGIIGPWGMHSRLVALRKGGVLPWWPLDEVDPRESSAPWKPRTVSCLRRALPDWAYDL